MAAAQRGSAQLWASSVPNQSPRQRLDHRYPPRTIAAASGPIAAPKADILLEQAALSSSIPFPKPSLWALKLLSVHKSAMRALLCALAFAAALAAVQAARPAADARLADDWAEPNCTPGENCSPFVNVTLYGEALCPYT